MKILSAEQQRYLDQCTLKVEGISSIELMERASMAFTERFCELYSTKLPVLILCGPGNNGGDGLLIARLLFQRGYEVQVFAPEYPRTSLDREYNFQRLTAILPKDKFHQKLPENFNGIVVDSLLGTGQTRPLEGEMAGIVEEVNAWDGTKVSVDIPTGLLPDSALPEGSILFKSHLVLTFHAPKLSFFLPPNGLDFEVLDIGLMKEVLPSNYTFYLPQKEDIFPKRRKFSHKGNYGFGLLVAGSFGMYGAAVLAAKAALRSGIGKLSVLTEVEGIPILQGAVPEAMCILDIASSQSFNALGIGPGLGRKEESFFEQLFTASKGLPTVLDADALNALARFPSLWNKLPAITILTPHVAELERLLGIKFLNAHERLEAAREFAKEKKVILVLKGAYTAVIDITGEVSFNSSGNAYMATAGSGDVLTGIILARLAQRELPYEAAKKAVFLHGNAGDVAIQNKNYLIASDIINSL